MLANPYFWLGELGLFLSIVSCAVLLHRSRHGSWYEIIPLFLALIFSLAILVQPAIWTLKHTIPAIPYLYRLAVGLVLASRVWTIRIKSKPTEILEMDRVMKWSSITLTLLVAYIVYRIRHLGR
jgi:hypothetical protein